MVTFIGRETELQRAEAILLSPACRLLTVLGPGGIGKTRLAQQLAQRVGERFDSGTVFVDLQRIESADIVIPTIAETLGFTLTGAEDALRQLSLYLREKHLLLVLDNFEHVLSAATALSALMADARRLKVLVTSREALRLQEEHLFTLSGLSVPDENTTDLHEQSAVRLFLTRARQVRHDFQDDIVSIAAICRTVEGSPLAIELAAVWARVLEAAEILAELRACLDFLTTDLRNIPKRHQSLRAVFKGSWDRLTEREQQTLRRLAVLQSGFDRAAAEAIAGTDLLTLAALRDKSLLNVSESGRYSIHTLIREYAREQLRLDEQTQIYHAYSAHYAQLTQHFAAMLRSETQTDALRLMQQDIQNIRVGWGWALDQADDVLIEQYLLGVVLYHQMQSRTQEASDLLALSVEQQAALSPDVRAQIQLLRSWLLIILAQNQTGVSIGVQALEALQTRPLWLGMALVTLTNHPELLGPHYRRVVECAQQTTAGDPWQRAWLLKAQGEIELVACRYESAQHLLRESAELFEQTGDRWSATWAYGSLGYVLAQLGHYDDAMYCYQQSLEVCQTVGDIAGAMDLLKRMAVFALDQGLYARAEAEIMRGFRLSSDHPVHPGGMTYLLDTLAALRAAQNRPSEAVEYLTTLLESPLVQRGWREPEITDLEMRLDALRSQLSSTAFEDAVQRGQARTLVERVRDLMQTSADTASDTTPDLVESLTEREHEVLRLISAGRSNRQIAEALTLTVGTVKTHAHNLYGKLGVTNRTEAAARARELKLV